MPSHSVRLIRPGLLAGLALVAVGMLARVGHASVRPWTLSHPHARAAAVLTGTVRGTYVIEPGIPDAGRSYALSGTGVLQPLGSVHGEGNLRTPGFVARGNTTGSLTLTGDTGTV